MPRNTSLRSDIVTRSDTHLAAALGAALLIGYVPLLIVHGQRLWALSHYQYAPFVVVAIGLLLGIRWVSAKGQAPARRTPSWLTEIVILSAAGALLGLAVVFYNPSLAMLSASFVIGVVFLWISRKRPVSNLWGIWCLLFLLIPLPFGFGDDLILGLQSLSSTISSQLLDLAASTM